MELHQINVKTSAREQIIDITGQIQQIVTKSRVTDGYCQIFIPHTTAGITINENADGNVKIDFLHILGKLIPQSADYLHSEGNSDAHVKASLVGFSQNIFISNSELLLGTWQGLWFCEFDGPRTRKVLIRLEAAKE
ncbi:MAG: secondary thiamine-phosphate synthase enzyme YjbQ [Candidatus Helarchaeota archaeon]|nr:secondary thiamine-phosphate synthase enzyme YjbQ [Candidatus Helarchaeota archaeon]